MNISMLKKFTQIIISNNNKINNKNNTHEKMDNFIQIKAKK